MSEREKLIDLAARCEQEAKFWRGSPMRVGLLDVARQLRSRAAHPKDVEPPN